MSDDDTKLNLPPIPSITADNRWVVDESFKPLPEEVEEVYEIPTGTYAHDLGSFSVNEEHLDPDPLEYFNKLKRTIIWTIILATFGSSLIELTIIKFFM